MIPVRMTPFAMTMAVLLAGGSVMPVYQQPDAPVPAAFAGDRFERGVDSDTASVGR